MQSPVPEVSSLWDASDLEINSAILTGLLALAGRFYTAPSALGSWEGSVASNTLLSGIYRGAARCSATSTVVRVGAPICSRYAAL